MDNCNTFHRCANLKVLILEKFWTEFWRLFSNKKLFQNVLLLHSKTKIDTKLFNLHWFKLIRLQISWKTRFYWIAPKQLEISRSCRIVKAAANVWAIKASTENFSFRWICIGTFRDYPFMWLWYVRFPMIPENVWYAKYDDKAHDKSQSRSSQHIRPCEIKRQLQEMNELLNQILDQIFANLQWFW